MATSQQRTPFFYADSLYIDSCLNLSTMATFFCPQGATIVERFDWICPEHILLLKTLT